LERYFFGIPICTANGEKLSEETILQKIRAAQGTIENTLSIKLMKQIMEEKKDFIRGEFQGWGFIRTTYQIRHIIALEGFINTISQIVYPSNWVSINQPSDEKLLLRQLHIVPAGSDSPLTNSVVYSGITPHLGFFGQPNIPNYWFVEYCTGFEIIPDEIVDVIGKLASQQLLAILGDILFGVGVASSSLGFDGLSQSISTTKSTSSSAFSARINQYEKELEKSLSNLKDFYKGISWTVC
jgi:hypothetical protein